MKIETVDTFVQFIKDKRNANIPDSEIFAQYVLILQREHCFLEQLREDTYLKCKAKRTLEELLIKRVEKMQ